MRFTLSEKCDLTFALVLLAFLEFPYNTIANKKLSLKYAENIYFSGELPV